MLKRKGLIIDSVIELITFWHHSGFNVYCTERIYPRSTQSLKVKINSSEVVEFLAELFCQRGLPEYIRSDNGSEFTARKVRKFIRDLGALPTFIEPCGPWENGYIEFFNGKIIDELLSGEIFDTIQEAKVLIERWRSYYNTIRPQSALEYRPPPPESRVLDINLKMA